QFSRSGQRQVSSLDVREELERTLELAHTHLLHRRITLQREFSPQLPLVQADRQQLRQLFLNLMTNASDAMPQGGVLTLRIRPQPGGDGVEIDIQDTGIGIRPGDLRQVMEPFYTTKTEGKGTGLGLAICRRIVEEHKGSIRIASPGEGQGTMVKIWLPGSGGSQPEILDE
ncbi:MAG TPA: ATP-binding protein, partial [Anaerolineales bacterium]